MIEKKIFYLIILTLGVYLIFTDTGRSIISNLARSITGNTTSSSTSSSSNNIPADPNLGKSDIDWSKVFGSGTRLG